MSNLKSHKSHKTTLRLVSTTMIDTQTMDFNNNSEEFVMCDVNLTSTDDDESQSMEVDNFPEDDSSNKKNKRKTVVSFTKMVAQYHVLHLNDYTDDEIDACWYERCEMKAMKHEVKRTVKKIVNGTPLNDENDKFLGECAIGLEGFTPDGSQIKLSQRRDAIDALLDEQDDQIMYNFSNPQALADAYKEKTFESSIHACVRAIQMRTAAQMSCCAVVIPDNKQKILNRSSGSKRSLLTRQAKFSTTTSIKLRKMFSSKAA